MKRSRFFSALLLGFLMISATPQAFAEDGVTPTEVKIGLTCPVTGIIAPYMKTMLEGMQVAINKINSGGGIAGRKIKQVVLDDAYDAPKAAENVKKLVEEEKVFALIGGAGTPLTKAYMPYISARGVPLLFPVVGGLDPDKVYFNVRVTYMAEALALVEYALKNFKGKTMGIFYQDDAFGKAGKNGVARVLSQHGLQIHGEGHYDRATNDVSPGIAEIMKTKPDIVYLQTLPPQALDFIKKSAEKGYRPIILATSMVSVSDLQKILGKDAHNIFVSQVLPFPTDASYKFNRDYQADMKAAGKEFNDVAAQEGYAAILVFAEIVKRVGPDLTRAKLISTIENMNDYDLGGLKLSFSKTKHFGLDKPFIVKLNEGKPEPVKD